MELWISGPTFNHPRSCIFVAAADQRRYKISVINGDQQQTCLTGLSLAVCTAYVITLC